MQRAIRGGAGSHISFPLLSQVMSPKVIPGFIHTANQSNSNTYLLKIRESKSTHLYGKIGTKPSDTCNSKY